MFQKSNQKLWVDESSMEIPYSRVTAHERLSERTLASIVKDAASLHDKLSDFKAAVETKAQELYNSFMEENNGKAIGKGKGGATFFNFDRSVKVEVSVNEQIVFDDNFISLAKQKLDEFIDSKISGVEAFIKDLIMSAFETSRGRLDTKKVLSLKKHAARIKDERYHEAMALIDKAIRKPESKTYFQVWVKDEAGQYKSIDLNFSSI